MTDTVMTAAATRFWRHVDRRTNDECWQWLGALDNGYGRFWIQGRTIMAHRFAYEASGTPIPGGLQLDHICRNRGCVNPAHLEPVTIRQNVLRGAGITATNARKTECRNGHPFSTENTYTTPNGRRNCKACRRSSVRAWRTRTNIEDAA